jgi:hypothetical protein
MPPAQMAKAYIDNNMVSKMDRATLARHLDFAANADSTKSTATSFTGTWSTPSGAFGADRINLYSEVYRSQPGTGIANETGKVSGLWTFDADLAANLNAITGTNFYWWNGSFAKPTGTLTCSGNVLINTTGIGVSRQTKSLSGTAFDGTYFGTDQLASACITPGTTALVYREIGTRTYTDTNVQLYYYVANRAQR